jgi:hypothetical protein
MTLRFGVDDLAALNTLTGPPGEVNTFLCQPVSKILPTIAVQKGRC